MFYRDDSLYRQVNMEYRENYDHLMGSGAYQHLVTAGLLVRHDEVDMEGADPALAYKVIRPEPICFISYPYEWSFSQLKDAAAAVLQIQRLSLDFGMSMRDCSAYNMQFRKGKPVLIDTLSFEKYRDGCPWVAYRQFCQHFLAPLALMSYTDIRLNQLLRIYIDGIPLDLASGLLPAHTWLRFSLLSHIHLHAKSQEHYARAAIKKGQKRMTRLSLRGLLDNLECTIRRLRWRRADTEWGDYHAGTYYSPNALAHKKQTVEEFLAAAKPASVWDIGGNMGSFSRLASGRGIPTISLDSDPVAVDKNYREHTRRDEQHILPLLVDLTNPSGGIGWENRERMSLLERGPADLALALALIHHLAISNNVPFDRIAGFFRAICKTLVIEFVPKHDPQVQRLLSTREDVFRNYTEQAFEKAFKNYFTIQRRVQITQSQRVLYLMRNETRV